MRVASYRFLFLILFSSCGLLPAPSQAFDLFGKNSTPKSAPSGTEHIVLSGGPALRGWEDFRIEPARHDRWWGNFIRAARVRMEQIRADMGPDAVITWLVFETGYKKRSKEDGEDHITSILTVRDKETVKCRLVWYNKAEEIIRYLNYGGQGVNRSQIKIGGFDYFGHSNKYAFTLDYSGEVLGAAKVFIHQDDLKQLSPGIFVRNAQCQSWGCHTAESMSKAWRAATGTKLIGAVGKTDYAYCWRDGGSLPIVSQGARWVR